jgi:predicted ATPase/DNA-binding CsgD family transcriptional regulator/DNA-binding XRE family transcriptional regulator
MPEEPVSDFADVLRHERQAAGLSQEELAERSGLSARAISAIERGVNRAPRRSTLQMLADALALSDDERRRWERLRRNQMNRLAQPAVSTPVDRPRRSLTLPPQLTAFFGRDAEIVTLARMLHDDGARLITLTGPGGIGKTRLALQVAGSCLDAYPDGVCFIDLASISDPQRVLPTIAASLGIWGHAEQPIIETVAEWLHEARLMIVLDNFEQVRAAAPEIGYLLGGCHNLQVLATSRAPLRVRGEREFPVSPLPVDMAGADCAESDAVRLFVDRARAVRPDGAVELDVVERICQRLDGLPLAIELAAASFRLFPVQTILSRLEQHLPLVPAGHLDAPARQQTLRETIAWSYELLAEPDQRLFRQLGVFAGGWTLAAAEAICDPDLDVLVGHAALIDQSMIRRAADPGGMARFTMLETIREYGLEQSAAMASAEMGTMRQCHADYFIGVAEAAQPNRQPDGPPALSAHLNAEYDNLRAAFDWCMQQHDVDASLRLVLALQTFWRTSDQRHFSEVWRWLERISAAGDSLSPTAHADALAMVSDPGFSDGDHRRARRIAEDALRIARQHDDALGVGKALWALTFVDWAAGDWVAAVDHAREALRLFEAAHDNDWIPSGLMALAHGISGQGDLEGAHALTERALRLYRERGDRLGIAMALGDLADTAQAQRNLEQALNRGQEALRWLRDLNISWMIVQRFNALAGVLARNGQAHRAARLCGAADVLAEAIGFIAFGSSLAHREATLPVIQQRLGHGAFTSAYAAGRQLTAAQALDEALSLSLRRDTLNAAAAPDHPGARWDLTPRQLQVLRLVAQGLTDAEVAEQLFLARRTVNSHLTAIYTKLNVNSRTAAARFAIEAGLT